MSSTEVFTNIHTTVSGKVTLLPEFFDGLVFGGAHGIQFGPSIPELNELGESRALFIKTPLSEWDFLMIQDFTQFNRIHILNRHTYQHTNPSTYKEVKISPEINTFLKGKNLLYNKNRIYTISLPYKFISEPHVSYFLTPTLYDISIVPVKRTLTDITFGITWQYDYNKPTEPIYLHWQATGPIISTPTENLLD